MSTLHQNPPAVKAPITDAEWAAYRASRNARQARPPVAWQVGDRVLYHTPRSSRGGGRNIRGVVVKVNPKTVTIEYAMLNRMTQEIVGYKQQSVNPMRLARVIEPVAEVNCKTPDLINVQQDGFDLDLLPWENPQDVIDQANAVLDEMDYKPGLGIDDEFDELEFMGATLDTLRLGLVEPVVRLTSAQMDEIEDERPGEHFSREPFAY